MAKKITIKPIKPNRTAQNQRYKKLANVNTKKTKQKK